MDYVLILHPDNVIKPKKVCWYPSRALSLWN